jgi:hypothetical protein
MLNRRAVSFVLLLGFGFGSLACKKKEEEESGKAAVAFANTGYDLAGRKPQNFRENTVTPVTPDVLGMKLVVVYLVPDIDSETQDNIGVAARIWTNPVCDADLNECSIADVAGEYQVKDYFDFARSTEDVNEDLNSQAQTLDVGTYRYLQVDFKGPTDEDDTTKNLEFGMKDGETYEVKPNWGNGYSVKLAEPIEIEDGDSVLVTLAYDFTDSFYDSTDLLQSTDDAPDGDIDNWYCGGESDDDGVHGPCIHFTGFTPSAKKL